MVRPVTLGSGEVSYHADRPIIHFGSPAAQPTLATDDCGFAGGESET